MGTIWNCSEGAIFIYLTIYYYWISKNWVWTQVYGAATNFVALFLLFWIPESPKFLYSEKRFKECITTLQKMKKFNTGNSSSSTFTSLLRPELMDDSNNIIQA